MPFAKGAKATPKFFGASSGALWRIYSPVLALKCTRKVRDMLGLKDNELVELSAVSEIRGLGAWFINSFIVERRKFLIFMNERTLLSFVLFGVSKTNMKKDTFPQVCLEGVVQLLTMERFPAPVIARVIEESLGYCYAKTDSKRVLGNMNDLVSMYEYLIAYDGGLAQCDLNKIILRINRTPQRNIDWQYSIDAARRILGVHAP